MEGDSGTYLLTVQQFSPYKVYFSDRPATIAGSKPVEEFIQGYDWDSAPANAAIVLLSENEDEDTLIVQMSKPVYDAAKQSFSSVVKPFDDYQGSQLGFYVARSDKTIPESFEDVEIYVE